jgi:chemotaxis family two-component system response regulator Rcp1
MDEINILLVEDSPSDVRLTQEALKRSDMQYQVEVVSDGVEAMDRLAEGKKNGTLPDIMLLDLNMPRKNGHEVLQEMINDPVYKAIPVILLTVSEREEDVQEALKRGMNYYLAKPVTAPKLSAIIKSIHELQAEAPTTGSKGLDDMHIRLVLAGNPHTAPFALEKLANDPSPRVRARVAEHPGLPVTSLEKLANDADPDVRVRVSENPKAPHSLLQKLAKDPSEEVRMGVSENPNVPPEILQMLAEDENTFVSSAATRTLSQVKGVQ